MDMPAHVGCMEEEEEEDEEVEEEAHLPQHRWGQPALGNILHDKPR